MNIDGACLCGAVTYKAEIDPKLVFICHCADCQTHSGSSFRTLAVGKPGSFRLLSGEMASYVRTSESGRPRELTFCLVCGTPIYGGPGAGEEGPLSLRVGAIAQREELKPVAQFWCRSAQSWVDEVGNLPKTQTQPGRD